MVYLELLTYTVCRYESIYIKKVKNHINLFLNIIFIKHKPLEIVPIEIIYGLTLTHDLEQDLLFTAVMKTLMKDKTVN